MTKRAVTYARVSSDDRGKDGRNLDGQLEMCQEYAMEKGYILVAELAEDDRGASGASFELEKLGELLEMAKNKAFDILVVREIDRLSRNLAKQLIVEEELLRAGVKIEYVLGDYADTPEGNLMKHVRAVVAEYEREKIKERIQRGKRLKVKAGSVMLSLNQPPYGYRVVEDQNLWKLEICEPEAEIIRMMFYWYVEGDENRKSMTARSIAVRLTELKIPTPIDIKRENGGHGYKKRGYAHWSASAVRHYLSSDVYHGQWVYGRNSVEPITVDVPAIIEPELWKAAQKARKEKYIENLKNRKHNYLFARRIRCGMCASVVNGTPVNGYLYYRCLATKKDMVAGVTCKAPYFRLGIVEEVVWDWIKNLLENPQVLQEGIDAHIEENIKQLNPFRERLIVIDSLIETNDRELDRLLELYLSGEFPKEVLISRKNDIETTLQSLKNEKNKLLETVQQQELTPKRIDNIFEFARQISEGLESANENFAAKRAIIDDLEVHVILSVEEGEKVVYAECILGEASLKIDGNKNEEKVIGGNLRNKKVAICAGYRRRSLRQANRDQAAVVPVRVRRQ